MIVTTGWLSSLYSSAGCDFIRLDIGFTPSNEAWNQSTAELGLFVYQSGESSMNKYHEAFVDGCQWYEDTFNEDFIEHDRTWKVARIMAYISFLSSALAMTTSWLFVISPLPASFFWPGVLLPSLMVTFLAEGSKFLFFDTSICRNTVWFPTGADSLPRVAEKCSLGTTGQYAIVGGTIHFLCLILICLKAPEKRELESLYGEDFDHGANDLESAQEYGYSERSYAESRSVSVYDTNESEDRDGEEALGDRYTDELVGDAENPSPDTLNSDEDLFSKGLPSQDTSEDRYPVKPKENQDGDTIDRCHSLKSSSSLSNTVNQTVSESRLHTAERMELNTVSEPEDMIANFVNEVNESFQVETEDKQKEQDLAHSPPAKTSDN